jgi:citronellol/citronellal dehydrogenase
VHNLKGKTIFISGASRGIGEAIALRAAKEGANIVIGAKSDQQHPKLPGTIHTVAKAVEKAGGHALAIKLDIRNEENVVAAMAKAAEHFGGIDVLVNNASAISLTGTASTPMKRFDLMMDVNTRGTFACSQAALPYLKKSDNPHILMLSPPLNMKAKWFKNHTAYTIAKYGMSMCVLGMSEEFKSEGIAVNALWPCTVIGTAALAMLGGMVKPENCRTPEIVAEAACAIFKQESKICTGNFFSDEDVLQQQGVVDFSHYAVDESKPLQQDLFLD